MSKEVYSSEPSDWYFAVHMPEDQYDIGCVGLSTDSSFLDDQLEDLPKEIASALSECGIHSECALMESVWEIRDKSMTEQQIIKALTDKGFNYQADLFG